VSSPVTGSAPAASKAGEAHLEVDSSFAYHGNEATPDLYGMASRLSLSTDNSKLALALLPQVSGPTPENEAPARKPGLLHRLGSLLGRLVGR
jgi:hypothetical protein